MHLYKPIGASVKLQLVVDITLGPFDADSCIGLGCSSLDLEKENAVVDKLLASEEDGVSFHLLKHVFSSEVVDVENTMEFVDH